MRAVNETILLVDDEKNILSSLSRLFRRDGYELLTAESGSDALELLDKHTPALIISDCRMPEMDGVEFLSRVKKISPNSVRFMLTGHADLESVKGAINSGEVTKYITKPWADDELRQTVKEALERHALIEKNKELLELTRKQNAELTDLNANLEVKVEQKTSMIRDNLFAFVRIVADMVEFYDQTLVGHSKRVATLSKGVAGVMGFGGVDVDLIESAALLHNIGLIGVPRSVIEKNEDDLNDDERAVIKESHLLASKLIGSIGILKQAGILIKGQSERFNGSGYPDGLKGEEIHVGSRILAACKRYDDLRYSKKMAHSRPKAIEVMKHEQGSRFDPDVVVSLVTFLERFDEEPVKTEVLVLDIQEGMVLAENLVTIKGKLLLTCGTLLSKELISKILMINKIDPINSSAYVIVA